MRTALFALPLLFAPLGLQAQAPLDRPSSMLVYDVSGSMWGQIDGKAKVEIAREVIADLLKGWTPEDALGLVAYGHRSKGDCKDIETLITPGTVDAAAFSAKVNALTPKGKTPITDAVTMAAEELKYTEEAATVILLTDGLETCNADPCAAAEKLEQLGVHLTVHVVGFDIKKEDEAQLRCVAEKTGGEYLSAANASELTSALQQASAPPAPLPEASLTPEPAEPAISSDFAVAFSTTPGEGDYILLRSKEGAEIGRAYAKDGNPARLKAPADPGVYELRYVYAAENATIARIDLPVGALAASITAPAEVNAGATFTVSWTGPNAPGDILGLYKAGDNNSVYQAGGPVNASGTADLTAPVDAGAYEMRYVIAGDRRTLVSQPVMVKEVAVSVSGPASVKAGEKFEVIWQGPGGEGHFIMLARPTDGTRNYEHRIHTNQGSPVTFTAPAKPGPYELRYVVDPLSKRLFSVSITVSP